MKIETFTKLFETKHSDEEKEKVILEIMKREHIKYVEKIARVKLIVKNSYYTKKKNLDGVEYETFEQNSPAKYLFYCLTLVDLYTTLEIDFKKASEQFEMLNGEILDMIINSIDEREHKEFQMLLDFACDDLLVNEYEPHAFIRSQVERFSSLISTALLPILQQLDMEQLKEVIHLLNSDNKT